MSEKREDNGDPILLYSEGCQRLPDGRKQLLIRCADLAAYVDLPKRLRFGRSDFNKVGFDNERLLAFYRTGVIEDAQGAVNELI